MVLPLFHERFQDQISGLRSDEEAVAWLNDLALLEPEPYATWHPVTQWIVNPTQSDGLAVPHHVFEPLESHLRAIIDPVRTSDDLSLSAPSDRFPHY